MAERTCAAPPTPLYATPCLIECGLCRVFRAVQRASISRKISFSVVARVSAAGIRKLTWVLQTFLMQAFQRRSRLFPTWANQLLSK